MPGGSTADRNPANYRFNFILFPPFREADGLAQSSRNRRLTADQRKNAVAISQALNEIREKLASGDAEPLLKHARKNWMPLTLKQIIYPLPGPAIFNPSSDWNGKEKAVALIAAFQGEVRLIDNMLLN